MRLNATESKDLEEPIVAMTLPDMWGGLITLANCWQLELPPMMMAATTTLPVTVEARKIGVENKTTIVPEV